MRRIAKLSDVVDWRLCTGCGACAYACPEGRVQLIDYSDEGIRPLVDEQDCGSCRQCLDMCPGVQSDFSERSIPIGSGASHRFIKEWGPVVAMFEGHATDPEIRFKGSSGGVLTAIGAYCLEVIGMHGVLHIAQDPDDPLRNLTKMSQKREDLLAATGSRYSPASVCNGLGMVESAPSQCVVIGKPSEISAVRNARKMRPELDRKVGVTLSFFCAESPSTRGTVDLLEKLNVDPSAVSDLRYRGCGWPGHFAPIRDGEIEPCKKVTYRESWAFLQAYRPWSVQLWPDGTGEVADISCGDPWYDEPDGENVGFSLVVARTQRGREIVEGAMRDGYLDLVPAEHWKLEKSQSGLLEKKGAIWGRRLAMKLFGLPVTRFDGLELRHCWKLLSLKERLRAVLGTVRRILRRRIYRRDSFQGQFKEPVKIPNGRQKK